MASGFDIAGTTDLSSKDISSLTFGQDIGSIFGPQSFSYAFRGSSANATASASEGFDLTKIIILCMVGIIVFIVVKKL